MPIQLDWAEYIAKEAHCLEMSRAEARRKSHEIGVRREIIFEAFGHGGKVRNRAAINERIKRLELRFTNFNRMSLWLNMAIGQLASKTPDRNECDRIANKIDRADIWARKLGLDRHECIVARPKILCEIVLESWNGL
jgi:hypothetical protein